MSKTVSIPLKAHYAQGSTTIARCWRFERKDGVVIAVTNCARDILWNGEVYKAKDGVNPSAIEQQSGGATNNSEVAGALAASGITEQDILKGLWDGALVTIFEVNYRDLTMGRMLLPGHSIGQTQAGRSNFRAEVRGLEQALQLVTGEVYSPNCPANFGDARCKKDLGPLTVTGTVTDATSRRVFVDTSRSEADDWFGGGLVIWITGDNAGASMEIADYSSDTFSLALPMPSNIAVGDTYQAIPGCRKRWVEDCVTKWANGNNFRGFPHVPGGDKVLGLGGTQGNA